MGSNEKEIDSSSYIASASSIFHIRLCLGVYSLRKEVLPYLENGCSEEENSRHFDALYDNVFQPLCSSIRCYCNIKKLIDDYLIRIHQGSVIKLSNGVLIIEETINHDLNDLLRLFINNTYQAFHEQQSIMRFFGVDISAIYVKEFNKRMIKNIN